MVEMGLLLAGDISYSDDNDDNVLNNIPLLPLWSRWLLQFLQSPEPTFHDDNDNDNNNNNNDGTIWPSSLLPRYFGVLYWFIVVVLTSIPTLRIVEHQAVVIVDAVVVVRRKWFHLIAVLLFGPITWIFPQLMALGYAIALCGLAILESLRKTPQLPALHTFYKALIDPHKDNVNTIVFSHMFLILGCAVPLWMKMMKTTTMTTMTMTTMTGKDEDNNNNNNDLHLLLLLSQWGVLSLGVGDAMGALVGTYFGKHRWGRNRRTIEGSAAMWTSMMIIGGMVLSCSSSSSSSSSLSSSLWSALLVATTFTTLLEAYTLQMDNFILPLAGAVILLRFQK